MGSDVSPKKIIDVAFDIKLTTNSSVKKNLLGSSKGSKHNELAPLQTRVITTYGG